MPTRFAKPGKFFEEQAKKIEGLVPMGYNTKLSENSDYFSDSAKQKDFVLFGVPTRLTRRRTYSASHALQIFDKRNELIATVNLGIFSLGKNRASKLSTVIPRVVVQIEKPTKENMEMLGVLAGRIKAMMKLHVASFLHSNYPVKLRALRKENLGNASPGNIIDIKKRQ
ncbi:MAG: hypothetical protein V1835_07300 [Candidatus Micrarchaeota archaeon]